MEHETTIDPKTKKIISIVVPVYFNEPNLPDIIPQLLALATDCLSTIWIWCLWITNPKSRGKIVPDLADHTHFIRLLDNSLSRYRKA